MRRKSNARTSYYGLYDGYADSDSKTPAKKSKSKKK